MQSVCFAGQLLPAVLAGEQSPIRAAAAAAAADRDETR